MEHLAIMKKSWDLTSKILSGKKKVESRWYKTKRPPWDLIKSGDVVYFKDSGEPVTIKAEVEKMMQFSRLTQVKVRKILDVYGKDDGIESGEIQKFFEIFKDKKYCILIFLKNPTRIEPFQINKNGFGTMAAWISSNNINQIKV
jgi:ASC-1-like (ASCH) protein